MATPLNAIKSLKRWQMVVLIVVLIGVGGSAYTVYGRTNGSAWESLAENQEIVTVQYGDLVNQVSTNGSLVFPEKEALAFGTEGKVEELLVEEGQRVEKGDLLAKLDPVTVASLERAVAQDRLDLQTAGEDLEEVQEAYSPLELAEAEERVAGAKFLLQEASDALDEAREPYTEQEIKAQEEAVAAARLGWRDAVNGLDDLQPGHSLRLAEAVQARADAGAVLDSALETLANLGQDHSQRLADVIQDKADAERSLEQAVGAVQRYDEANDEVIAWRQDKLKAEADLTETQQHLSKLRLAQERGSVNLGPNIQGAERLEELQQEQLDDLQETLAEVEQLEANLVGIRAELVLAQSELTKLEKGPDPLERQELEARVLVAQADWVVVGDALAGLKSTVDPLELALAEAQAALAQAALEQAEEDLAEVLAGADPLEVALREKQVTLAKEELDEAGEDLLELLEGPDPLDVSLAEAEVASARLALQESIQRLEDSSLWSPIDGLVTLVGVEEGDQVGARATIVEIADTSIMEVDGIVDEVDVLSLREGIKARVSLDALPGRPMEGTLTQIAPAAQNQQGVVSYPIRIRVEVPRRMRPREGLTAVATIVLREEKNVLRIPQQALQGTFEAPVVQVKTPLGVDERKVVLGDTDDYWVAVREGLAEGDQVIMESADASTSQFSYRQLRSQFRGSSSGRSGGGRGSSGGRR